RPGHVTLNSSSAFSYYWMMPKLPAFRAAHPKIDLRLQNSDGEPDLDAENIALSVRRGQGDWPDCHAAKIADEVIFPVASPLVMQSAPNLRSIPNLLHERLIHLEEPIRQRPTWKQWFAHHGIEGAEIREGLRLNDYALVLRAAQTGEGFAFGWEHVVRDMIDQKILAARDDWAWATGNAFYLCWSKARPLSPQAKAVRDWVLEQC
ncbi:MAG: LysR substrate-binding domain-containing protein, partial [Pseudomonadota bacterium]